MLTLLSFLLALAVLITVHEYGHYRVAIACGVKVLRFSFGFGRVLWRWQRPGSPTEFVISAIPLGGYVRMLDEREAPVSEAERHLSFNAQPLAARAAIVAAGPLMNLGLAVLLYALVHWSGVTEPQAVLATPPVGSLAARAGLASGDEVLGVAREGAESRPVASLDQLRWQLVQAALEGENVTLDVVPAGARHREPARPVALPLSRLGARELTPTLFEDVGVTAPWTPALIADPSPQGAGYRAGLRKGDLVLRIGDDRIDDGLQLRQRIRASLRDGQAAQETWLIERDGRRLDLLVQADVVTDNGQRVARIDARVGALPAMTLVRYGPLDGLWLGVTRTWDTSALTLRTLGRMLVGQASLRNLSGPLTLAEYAGKSAQSGLVHYLLFLAMVSVSLGVLNLLPLPVLDGGHLMYYLWEAVTGRSPSEAWLERLQRGGIGILLLMMSLALFNDLSRLLVLFSG